MKVLRIAAIVEGDGECTAVPALIRRFGEMLGFGGKVVVHPVLRVPASLLVKPGQLERHVELAARKLQGPGGVFVLLDCEDDCPADLGPKLSKRAKTARPDLPVALVLAHREYEAWFLAAAESLASKRGFPADLAPPANPEAIRGCKEWLCDQLPKGAIYDPCDDQTALTVLFDMMTARENSDSFDKCWRELTALLAEVATVTPGFDS